MILTIGSFLTGHSGARGFIYDSGGRFDLDNVDV